MAFYKLKTFTGLYSKGLPDGLSLRRQIHGLRHPESFLEAIDYYQTRLLELNQAGRTATRYEEIELDPHSGNILLGDIRLPFSEHYPFYLLMNRNHLFYLNGQENPRAINAAIDRLLSDYDRILQQVLNDIFEKQKNLYTSYLNQSRYGLARHYDETREGAQ